MTTLAAYVLQLLTNAAEAGSTTSPPLLGEQTGLDARVPSGGSYLDDEE